MGAAQAQDWPSLGYLQSLQGEFNSRMRAENPNHEDVTFREFNYPDGGDPNTWGLVVSPENSKSPTPATTLPSSDGTYDDTILFEKYISEYYANGLDLSSLSPEALKELILLLLRHEFLHTTPSTPTNPDNPGGEDAPDGAGPGENIPCDHAE